MIDLQNASFDCFPNISEDIKEYIKKPEENNVISLFLNYS